MDIRYSIKGTHVVAEVHVPASLLLRLLGLGREERIDEYQAQFLHTGECSDRWYDIRSGQLAPLAIRHFLTEGAEEFLSQ